MNVRMAYPGRFAPCQAKRIQEMKNTILKACLIFDLK